jgi:hypothetical protein
MAIKRHLATDRPAETCDIVIPADATELHTWIVLPSQPGEER